MNDTISPSPRCIAIDILRGLSIAGMILVNNPGASGVAYPLLRLTPWAGCTPADLVFPFFLFIIGASMALSMVKREEASLISSTAKVVVRSTIIFIIGLLLNAFPYYYPPNPDPSLSLWENYLALYENVRFLGVFQRIALCYLLGGMLVIILRKTIPLAIALLGLIALHWYILVTFGNTLAAPYHGIEGIYSLWGQAASQIDLAIIAKQHLYQGYGLPFDPEGLLGTLTGAATLILGVIAGQTIASYQERSHSGTSLYTLGLFCLGAGILLAEHQPIIKGLWTGSYVLYAGGWSIILLAFFIYLVDIKQWGRVFLPLKAMGMNPLFAYILADLGAKTAAKLISWTDGDKVWNLQNWYYQECCCRLAGESGALASLLYSSSWVLIVLIPCLVFYRFKVVIKL